MAYTKTSWVNDQTALNQDNMNNIEDGIEESHNGYVWLDTTAAAGTTDGDLYAAIVTAAWTDAIEE